MSPNPPDPTPISAAPTDVAPLGRDVRPDHEKTGVEEMQAADWNAIAADQDFRELLISKAKFLVPATIFFIVYYFALPILVGWWPETMEQKVIWGLNWAYLFALSQFFMAWILAFLYVAVAKGWDKRAARVLHKFNR